jgi:hypothetical protein
MSLFRYGLDYVQMAIQRLIGFGKKEEFKEILAILRRQMPDRIRFCEICRVQRNILIKHYFSCKRNCAIVMFIP